MIGNMLDDLAKAIRRWTEKKIIIWAMSGWVCLLRRLNFVRHLSPDFQLSLGPPGNDQPDSQAGKLSIASLMMQIQAWAPKILQTCDDENRLDLQLQLYAAVRWILNVMANLPKRDKAVVNQRKNIYSSFFFFLRLGRFALGTVLTIA